MSQIARLIETFWIAHHKYSVDKQLYAALITVPFVVGLNRLAECAATNLFWRNDLQINPDKSDAAFFGTRQHLSSPGIPPTVILVAGCRVATSDRMKFIGIAIDRALTFDNHADDVVRASNYHTARGPTAHPLFNDIRRDRQPPGKITVNSCY